MPDLAYEIEQTRLEMGLSTEEMLQALREQRARYYQEKYRGKTAQ